MMSDTIIVAIISLLGTLCGSAIGVLASQKLINYRVERLEEEVRNYNRMSERIVELEKKDIIHQDELNSAKDNLLRVIDDIKIIKKAVLE